MPSETIFITASDMARLRQMTEARYLAHVAQQPGVHIVNEAGRLEALLRLEAELDRAEVVEPDEIPDDVITMNSHVRLRDVDTGQEMSYRLVFPAQAWGKPDALSVLSPLGTALLGYRTGDTLRARTPGGERNLQVLELLHQPEWKERIA
jgi:regulator of nucleoside diphosphate kinase